MAITTFQGMRTQISGAAAQHEEMRGKWVWDCEGSAREGYGAHLAKTCSCKQAKSEWRAKR